MQRCLVILLSAAIVTPGCATATASRALAPQAASPRTARVDPQLMADYVRQIPVGSRVRVTHEDGTVIRGILMKHDDPIVVQRRTRLPEPPVEIAVRDVLALELEKGNGGSAGRTVALGAAAAASATLGVLLVLAAIFSD